MGLNLGDSTLQEDIQRFLGLQDEVYEGTLASLPDDTTALVQVEIQPEGADIEARYVYSGATAEDRGLYIEPQVGDDVVVLILNGDRQRAVAFAGRVSPAKPKPTSLGPGATVVHPNGTQVVLAAGNAVQKAVLAPLPADLSDAWSTLRSNVLTAGQNVTTNAPSVSAAAAGITAASPIGQPLGTALGVLLGQLAADLATIAAQMVEFETKLAEVDAYLSRSLETD